MLGGCLLYLFAIVTFGLFVPFTGVIYRKSMSRADEILKEQITIRIPQLLLNETAEDFRKNMGFALSYARRQISSAA